MTTTAGGPIIIAPSAASRPRLTALKIWLSILLLGLAAYGGVTLWRVYGKINEEEHPRTLVELNFPVGEFELTERSGRTFNSKELLGQIWVATFFFGSCPTGDCPRLNNRIADLLAGDLADEPVKFVSITVDPKVDTAKQLCGYAEVYVDGRKIDPKRWLFLTQAQGSDEVVAAICQSHFHMPYAKASHSMKLLLVDQRGYVRGSYSSADPVDLMRLKKKIEELHQHPPAAKKDSPRENQPPGAMPNDQAPMTKEARIIEHFAVFTLHFALADPLPINAKCKMQNAK